MPSADGKEEKEQEVCPQCGKRRGVTLSGSITAWIFKEGNCSCNRALEDSLTERPPSSQSFASMGSDNLSTDGGVGSRTRLQALSQARKKALTGTDLGNVELPRAPKKFGERYEIIELVGEGGMASVYKVKDVVLNQFFSIKVIRSELARDEDSRKRFEKEARAARELNHSNIVTIYAFDISKDGVPYLIMDYVEGIDLGKMLSSSPLKLDDFYEIFTQVCGALAHAHSRGVVHRDLKPSNILISQLNQKYAWAKIVDFGIAKIVGGEDSNDLTKTGDFLGSPIYTSPEQAQGEAVDARSDIYSIGCVMFEALAGRPPFTAPSAVKLIMQHINNLPPNLITFTGARVPIALERVILRCLEKRPEDRYQNAFDLRRDLELVKEGEEPLLRASIAPPSPVDTLTDWFEIPKDEKGMNTVFDGRLSFDVRLNNVLERIIELAFPGDSILRLESQNPEFAGVIVIRGGYQILGAKILKQPIAGYDALRKMLSLADGQFKYMTINRDDYRLPDNSLQLNLNYILYLYPALPESPSALLDQAALQDLVFAVSPEELEKSGGGWHFENSSDDNDGGAAVGEEDHEEHWIPVGQKQDAAPVKKKSTLADSNGLDTLIIEKEKPKKAKLRPNKAKGGWLGDKRTQAVLAVVVMLVIGIVVFSLAHKPEGKVTTNKSADKQVKKKPAHTTKKRKGH